MRTRWLLLLPWVWLLLLVGAPLLILLAMVGAPITDGIPPFDWPVAWQHGRLVLRFSAEAFSTLVADDYYLRAFLRAVVIAGCTGILCLLLAYPMALGLARLPERRRPFWLLLIMLPFWSGFLLRMAAWIGLLRDSGWLNGWLLELGLVQHPLPLLYSTPALLLGMAHAYLPFAVLPLYGVLARLDPALREAAADLGAGRLRAFLSVTLPLSRAGAAAGFLLVFIPAVGEFVIPDLLGAPGAPLIGRVLWDEFFQNQDWPLASLLALLLLAVLLVPLRLFQRFGLPRSESMPRSEGLPRGEGVSRSKGGL